MIPELGLFSLIVALMICLVQVLHFFAPIVAPTQTTLRISTCLQFSFLTFALGCLIYAYAVSDFTVINVVENSHSQKPLYYKIAGAWGNHEGSMVLFAWVLAAYGAAFSLGGTRHYPAFYIKAISLHGIVLGGILLFILLTSNPFERIFPPPLDGQDLNPLLQDIGLTIHPPFLYLGYVGFAIVYYLAVAGLMLGKIDKEWAGLARPWILIPWSMLTLGIGLGSWWAYRELGWGGWWFWDPVENASLLPWLMATALLHSNAVLQKRGTLGAWVALLAILTFSLSLVGTFLVRSGALTSVHSFANDPSRGLFILGYLFCISGGALLLYALRAARLESGKSFHLLSREGAMLLNNLFLCVAAFSILLGIIYPLVVEWLSDVKLSVGAPFYNSIMLPLAFPILLIMGIAPLLAWQKARWENIKQSLFVMLSVALAVLAIGIALIDFALVYSLVGLLLAAWLISGMLHFIRRQGGLKKLTRSQTGMVLAHLGIAVMLLGITGSFLWRSESEHVLAGNSILRHGEFALEQTGDKPFRKTNYIGLRTHLLLRKNNNSLTELSPEIRLYPVRGMETSETSIYHHPLYDLYAVISRPSGQQFPLLKIYHIPLIGAVWSGFALTVLGGIISATSVLGFHAKS